MSAFAASETIESEFTAASAGSALTSAAAVTDSAFDSDIASIISFVSVVSFIVFSSLIRSFRKNDKKSVLTTYMFIIFSDLYDFPYK
jgi:hypothetical protein